MIISLDEKKGGDMASYFRFREEERRGNNMIGAGSDCRRIGT